MTKFDRLKANPQLVVNFQARLQNDAVQTTMRISSRFRVVIEQRYEMSHLIHKDGISGNAIHTRS